MIIKIGEVEWHDLQRKVTFARGDACKHLRLQYIEHGELLECKDCNKQVSAVWALKVFFTQYEVEKEKLERMQAQIKADEERLVTHRAALMVQDAWRRRKMVPSCPHCHKGIEPPDGFGKSQLNPNYYPSLPMEMRPNLEIVKDEEA
jgi:hypothetical protein